MSSRAQVFFPNIQPYNKTPSHTSDLESVLTSRQLLLEKLSHLRGSLRTSSERRPCPLHSSACHVILQQAGHQNMVIQTTKPNIIYWSYQASLKSIRKSLHGNSSPNDCPELDALATYEVRTGTRTGTRTDKPRYVHTNRSTTREKLAANVCQRAQAVDVGKRNPRCSCCVVRATYNNTTKLHKAIETSTSARAFYHPISVSLTLLGNSRVHACLEQQTFQVFKLGELHYLVSM